MPPLTKAGPGRPKGSTNKITTCLKTAIVEAFGEVGGKDYLVMVAKKDPKTFCQLIGRALPLQVYGSGDEGELIIKWQQ